MAKAKRPTSKPAREPLARLRDNMKRLQRDAETLLTRTRKQASSLISRDQKRALNRLLDQAKRLGGDFEKRAQRVQKDVEQRSEKLLASLEAQITQRLEPIVRRLDLPTRKEVQGLNRRIGQLERRLQAVSAGASTTESSAESASPAAELFPEIE
jgi:polyhydroxyalkanoate synthesis regulator phasin